MKDRIKKIRKDAGMTQLEFGKRLGVKPNTITNYENGMRGLSDAIIFSICREFHVNEEWLRNGTGNTYKEKTKNQEIAAFVNDIMLESDEAFKKRFVSVLSRLDARDWETIERIIDGMVQKKEG